MQCWLQILKTLAYEAQYVECSNLLHLHAAILAKIEVGNAIWDSNFEQVKRMLLANQGKVDWSSRSGLRQHRTGRKHIGVDRPANAHTSCKGGDWNIAWWCKDFQSGSCNQSAPHTNNIHAREVSVRHKCARCFQKDGAKRSHPDTSPSCPHRSWQHSTHKPLHSTQIHPTSRLVCE